MSRRTRPDGDLELPRGVDAQAIARKMDQDHGCEGITFDQRSGNVLALRYQDDVAKTHKSIPLEKFTERRRPRGRTVYSLPPRSRK